MGYLSVPEERAEVEEQRVPQGYRLDGVVQIVTLEELYLRLE